MADIETHSVSSPVAELESNIESSSEENIQRFSTRDVVIGAIGFLLFLTILVFATQAIGVETLQKLMKDAGPLAPIIYIALKAITYVFAPLTSGPIQIIAAPLFGNVWLGTLYTVIGEVLGGSLNFWIARRFGYPIVARLLGKKGMQQVEDLSQSYINNWIYLAFARLILFGIWDFLSYAIGLAKSVRFSTYVLISTVVGAIPTFLFVWIGSEAVQDTQALILIYGLVIILILIPILLRRPLETLLRWLSKGLLAKD